MFDLARVAANVSERWKYKLEEVSPGIHKLDVAIKMKDDTWRYQNVWVWEIKGRHFGKDVIYMNSRCGEYNSNLNHYKLLKEGGYGTFAQVTITTDKRADGSPCETLIVQAVHPVETITEVILNEMLYDVAFSADSIEANYFGGDKH